MPGRMKGKAGEWGAGGALKAQRRPTAKLPGLSRKGPSARIPHARPPARRGELPPPPPPPGSEGSRRTCPFHCGSLCPAWRQSWIAGFLFIPDWAPFDSLYHPVPGWRLRC
ncbi:uncharacterized protein LOC116528207 isoform X4 [Sapajus apella]|uniref:Uncharacterized protein LOC116528207 isoform X4 n=1 Tax=Sapajus apella TaxID=9515 RepID=A0A6J3F6L0_SAPAP|nr:uncharacterized protein LOC116528207 isoform X4 [Sapajus apella]